MTKYILSILGVVILGVLIDVVVPSGSINKYIKSIFSIFVVAVMLIPIINFLNKSKDFKLSLNEVEIDEKILNFVFNERVKQTENNIIVSLEKQGLSGLVVELNYSTELDKLTYISCEIDASNLVIQSDNQHINKYELIKEVVKGQTNLTEQEIIIHE